MERISKEMEGANSNLMKELERKESMIEKYEIDIHTLKGKKKEHDEELMLFIEELRGHHEGNVLVDGLHEEISKAQEELRFEQSKNNKLKAQYQKLYELLCSATGKNIHQTFNEVLSQ